MFSRDSSDTPPNVTSEHSYASIENTCLLPISKIITVSSQVVSLVLVSSQVMSHDLNCASKISALLHLKTVFRKWYMMMLTWKFARNFCNFYELSRILSYISVEGNNGQDKPSLMNGASYEAICSDIKINSMSEPKWSVSFVLITTIFAVLFNVYLCGFIQCLLQFYAKAATKTENYDYEKLNDVARVPTMMFGCGDYKLSLKLLNAFF